MSDRLTKSMRESIANAAVDASMKARIAEFKRAEDALAREAYGAVYSKEELRAAKKLPAHWLRRDACLRFNVGGQTHQLQLADKDGLPVPYRRKDSDQGGYSCSTLGVIQPGDLCDRIRAHANAKEKLKAEADSALNVTKQMLWSISTLEKLRQQWPEGAPFYARYEGGPTVMLPAVRTEEVNALLGLKKAA